MMLVSQDIVKVNREGLFVNLEANRDGKAYFSASSDKRKDCVNVSKI